MTVLRLLALAALLAFPGAGGCAMYAHVAEPGYSRAWSAFAKQASSKAGAAADLAMPADDVPMAETEAAVPQARRVVKKVKAVLKSHTASSGMVQRAMDDLTQVEREAAQTLQHDPERLERLRREIAELKRIMEKKLLKVRSIEPCFSIAKRKKVRVAVIRFGDSVSTIRKAEQERWRRFLAQAGFDPSPVFLSSALSGGRADAASIRVAAARLGADAVLAYATFAATTESLLGESAAVLSFAKCMFVDVRTEYLYFNAEGESRKKSVSLPFLVCAQCVEEEAVGASVQALHREIRVELKRLENEEKEAR
jgi:hypothetical protein